MDSGVTVRTLAQGTVKALPPGKIFVNILEFKQVPGADFGPHTHLPAIVYTLRGICTITFLGGPTVSVGSGQAASIRLGADTQKNVDGRLGAVAIAGGLIVLVILLCAATFMRGFCRQITLAVLSSLAIGGGIFPLFGANIERLLLHRCASRRSARVGHATT